MLSVNRIEREECRVKTMDAVDEPRAERQKRKRKEKQARDRQRQRMRRQKKAGWRPRAVYEKNSITRTQPWKAAGFNCRRTWERHLAKGLTPPPTSTPTPSRRKANRTPVSQVCRP
jgi:hypothetical protein